MDFLNDAKTRTALVAALSAILVQLAAAHGFAVDPATANAITYAVVLLAVGLMASHAHVENGEAHGEAAVEAAKVTADKAP